MLAHPIRWAILRELSGSDRRVHELCTAAGAPQNLVSYHLGLLRKARMVSERRSSSDGRDVYYRVDFGVLQNAFRRLGASLHPALVNTPPGAATPRGSVLFLCTGNSARSQIAEALVRHSTGGRVKVASAGTAPEGVHPLVLKVLAGMEVGTRGLRSKHWSDLASRRFDRVITLCDIAREHVPARILGVSPTHWSVADPVTVRGTEARREAAFVAVADLIQERIGVLLSSMATASAA